MILANFSRGISAGGVEATQPGRFQSVGSAEIVHHVLADEPGEAQGLIGLGIVRSLIGMVSGSPQVAQLDENTIERTPARTIACPRTVQFDIGPSFAGTHSNGTATDGLHMFRKILQLSAQGTVVTIGVLTLVQIEWRPHTGVITVTLFSLSYPRRSLIIIVALFFIYAACLEIAQLYIPGRHPAVSDWIAGSFGALIGAVVGAFILRWWLRALDAIEEKAGADFP